MARKTRRQKQRAAARQPAMAQVQPGAAARPGAAIQPEARGASPPPRPAASAAAEAGAAPVGEAPVGEAAPGPPGAPGAPPAQAAPVPSPGAGAPAGEATAAATGRRRVERIIPGAAPPAASTAGPAGGPGRPARAAPPRSRLTSTAAMMAPLESEDPAIPFDRVPYVPADLRRVAVIAGIMVVLILIAWFVVAKVTTG
jgi:hypothetical protein